MGGSTGRSYQLGTPGGQLEGDAIDTPLVALVDRLGLSRGRPRLIDGPVIVSVILLAWHDQVEAVCHEAADHATQVAPTLGQVVGGVASGDIASGASDQITGRQLSETFAQYVGTCPGGTRFSSE